MKKFTFLAWLLVPLWVCPLAWAQAEDPEEPVQGYKARRGMLRLKPAQRLRINQRALIGENGRWLRQGLGLRFGPRGGGTVVDPRRLRRLGFGDVRAGDRVAVRFLRPPKGPRLRGSRVQIRNLRTGQTRYCAGAGCLDRLVPTRRRLAPRPPTGSGAWGLKHR